MNGIPVGVSNRHVHVKEEHLQQLFGTDYKLKVLKELSQPGEFAAEETVTIRTQKSEIKNVRILGPVRSITQVEISKTDSFTLGIKPPVRPSGKIEGTPGLTIIGPQGEVEIPNGVIIAQRHIHMTPDDAKSFGVDDGQYVSIKTAGERGLIFDKVLIRVKDTYALDMHIDTDEANAAGLKSGDTVELLA
ncbi:phosphate propanoyltransferase [Ectobacillus panaciterrae]|uniref:phosphate propanoyltransferase n=1 Tax=Ectobacillus panaciterrae TaxID=363872 RepID=UPI000413E5E2|nr:phosphate propanoyltransferase [Ectobacillus panaciterrae]